MNRVTIDIDEGYAGALSITAIGHHKGFTNVATRVFDIKENDYILIDGNGKTSSLKNGSLIGLDDDDIDMNNPLEPLKVSRALRSELLKLDYHKKNSPGAINKLDYTVIAALKEALRRLENER